MAYKYVLVNYWLTATENSMDTVSSVYTNGSRNAENVVVKQFKEQAENHQTNKATAHLWSDDYVVLVYDLDHNSTHVIKRINLDL